MKKILLWTIILSVWITSFAGLPVSAGNGTITVELNGEKMVFDTEPTIINDRVMVPMRAIFEALGCYVFWDDNSKTAKGVRNGIAIEVVVDEDNAIIDSVQYELEQSAVMTKENRVLVPVRFIAEALGADVNWISESRKVVIESEKVYQYFYAVPSSFSDLGTWKIDADNIKGLMNSDPSGAKPAVININVVEPGTYRLWIRARDYATNQQGTRYYTAAVDDMRSEYTFGQHGKEGFFWQDAGTFEITTAGEHKISLIDTSAFFARCSNVLLTNNIDYIPSEDISELEKICNPIDPYIFLPSVSYPGWTKKSFDATKTEIIENDSYKLTFYYGQGAKGELVQNEIHTKNNGEWVKVKGRQEELAFLMIKSATSEFNTTENQSQWVDQSYYFQGREINRLTNAFFKAGMPSWFIPDRMEKISDNEIRLHSENEDGKITVTYLLDDLFEEPKVTINATFNAKGCYSFLLYSGDAVKYEEFDTITSPYLYVKKALPASDAMVAEPFLRTPMFTLNFAANNNVKTPGVELTAGVVVDPSCVEQKIAYPDTAQFGMVYRTSSGLVRPQICAPMFGTDSARFDAGDTYEFSYRIINKFDTWYNTYKYVATEIYGVEDIRTNYFTSLNDAIYNATDLWLDDYYGGWDPKAMSYYNMEARDVTTQSNMLEAAQKYLITEDEQILDERTVPTIAYMLSRPSSSFKYNETEGGIVATYAGGGLPNPIGSPTGYEAYVFGSLYEMTQGRMPVLLDQALRKAPMKTLMSQKLLYKYTGNEIYKKNIIAKADELLANHTNVGENRKVELSGFVLRGYMDMLSTFIPAYEFTGEKKYLDAAEEGARLLCTALSALGYQNGYAEGEYYTDAEVIGERPVVHLGTDFFWHGDDKLRVGFYLDETGKYFRKFNKDILYEGTVPGWLPAPAGMGVEHPLSAKFGSHITANVWAGNLMKLAGYTGDEFFATMARNAMVGRYGNYNGYGVERYFVNNLMPDFPYEGPDFTTIYYHHIPIFMAMTDDYLINSIWYASKGNIEFPSLYQGGYAYFDTNQYGSAPGKFYDEEDMWLWITKGIIEPDSINIDYICARKNGKLGIALINEDNSELTTTVTLGSKIKNASNYSGTAVLYDAEGNKSDIDVINGKFIVTIPSKGIKSLLLDIPQVKNPSYINKYSYSNELGNTVSEHTRGKGYVIQLNEDVYHAYVYVTDTYKEMSSLTINYTIGNESYSKTVNDYPYEFIIKVDDASKDFKYSLTGVDINGKAENLGGGVLRPIDTDATSKIGVTQSRIPTDLELQTTSNLLPAQGTTKLDKFKSFNVNVKNIGQDNVGNFRFVISKSEFPFDANIEKLRNVVVEMKWILADGESEVTTFSYIGDGTDRGADVLISVPGTKDARAVSAFTGKSTLELLTLHYTLPDYAEESATK